MRLSVSINLACNIIYKCFKLSKFYYKHRNHIIVIFKIYVFLNYIILYNGPKVSSSELTNYQKLAFDLTTSEKYNEAKKIALWCYKINSKDIRTLLILLKISVESGNIKEAKFWYNECIKINKHHPLLPFYEKMINILEKKEQDSYKFYKGFTSTTQVIKSLNDDLLVKKYLFSTLPLSGEYQDKSQRTYNKLSTLDIQIQREF